MITEGFHRIEALGFVRFAQVVRERRDTDRRHRPGRLYRSQNYVVPACIRCNLTRGAMPNAAWMVLAPAMRDAREKGLFGDWTRKLR